MQKIVLIDIDGVLIIQTKEDAPASGIMFKKVYGVDANEDIIDNVGKTEKKIIDEVLAKILPTRKSNTAVASDVAYKTWAQQVAEALKKNPVTILPGVLDLLHELSKKNIPFGILTGNSYYRAEAKLISAGLDRYFRNKNGKLRGAFGNESSKREELVDIAKRNMGYPDAMAILIDDSRFVAETIQRLNIPHVMVATGNVSFEELKQYVSNVVPTLANGGWKEAIRIIEKY